MDFKKIRIIFLMLLFSISNSILADTINDATVLMKKQDYKGSIKVLNNIIKDNPEYAIAYTYRGYAFMMTEQYDKALFDYQKSDEISSTLDSKSGVQWALLAKGKYDESILAGNKILEQDPNNYYAETRIADAYLEKREYSKASEKYKQAETKHGKNPDLYWKLGLCEYYRGNKKVATELFQEGIKLNPDHKGLQYSLNAKDDGYSYLAVIPEVSGYNFKGSDFLGSGQKFGLGVSYSPNETWNIRANVASDKTQNLNSTKGVENYITDPINLAYISQLRPPATIASYYLNTPTNIYNLTTLLTSQDYITTKYSAGVSYKISERFSFHFTPHFIQSNTSLLNGGSAAQISLSYTNNYTLTFAASGISAPTSKGGQGTVTFYYPFLDKFYSSSVINGQYMAIKSTETVFISASPLQTTTETVSNNKTYAFFQQEFGYSSGYLFLGVGGRYGTARTPFMGENWIYTGFDLLYGGYGQIGLKTENITLQLQYSQDRWLDSRNEKPISDTLKLMLIWRL